MMKLLRRLRALRRRRVEDPCCELCAAGRPDACAGKTSPDIQKALDEMERAVGGGITKLADRLDDRATQRLAKQRT